MIKIVDKIIDYSDNVQSSIDRVSIHSNNVVTVEHKLSVRVTFKDWWNYITGKDCIHVTTKTIIQYEEITDTTSDTTDNTSKNPTNKNKKLKSRKKPSDSTAGEQSSKSE